MVYIETNSTDAAFNFACEEYCMEKFIDYPKVMLIWQADRCAMLGRYQIAQSEVKEQVIKKLGAKVVRRASGGGTIYTDLGNLLYTFIMPINNLSEVDFSTVCRPIVTALNKVGVKAELKGRNDILINGKKISGNAQTVKDNVLCSHGSLLYNANLDLLENILVVDDAKIKSKGITSIRSRVTNIIEHMPIPYSIYEFWSKLKEALFQEEAEVKFYRFTDEDIYEINRIKDEKFDSWDWNYGRAPEFNYNNEIRFGYGKLTVSINVNNGIIEDCKINGDFLGLGPIEPLEELVKGNIYNYEQINDKLKEVDLNYFLRGISREEFLTCIFG